MTIAREKHTIESRVHPPKIHQQTNHSHTNRRWLIILQLVLEDLTRLATPRHSIHIDIREIHALLPIRLPRKHLVLVLEHQPQKLILDVLAPQRDPVLLFQMLDLVARVHGADCPVCLASGADGHVAGCAVGGLVLEAFGGHKRVVGEGAGLDVGHFGFSLGDLFEFNGLWE